MLVLSRKPGEAIHIGDGVIVRVVKVQGSRVWIGIEADPEIQILRGELHEVRELIRAEENAVKPEPEPDVITWK
jgi:carbon storage regulator